MLLDPEVIITCWKEDDLLPFIIEFASEDVHCSVEKLSLIISNSYLDHFPFLPFSNPVPTPCMDSNKDQALITLPSSDLLQHLAGQGPDPLPEYKFSPEVWQNICRSGNYRTQSFKPFYFNFEEKDGHSVRSQTNQEIS